jgi:predicted Zn-dependent protease
MIKGKPLSPKLMEMVLARLRQLSAHEVGHTLGLQHNYAASPVNRASVMDYPAPRAKLDQTAFRISPDAYAKGIV